MSPNTTLTILELTERLALAEELLFSCFAQGTNRLENGPGLGGEKSIWKYDHMCLSAYESAQDYLIEHGLIKKEECSRK